MRSFAAVVLCALAAASLVMCSPVTRPEQVHIALAGIHGMRVAWFTAQETANSFVYYGKSPETLTSVAVGSQKVYLHDYGAHHVVPLDGLDLDTDYFYQVGDNATMSSVFSFHTPPASTSTDPIRLSIFGDMGYLDSVQRPMGALGSKTMAGNWSAVFSRQFLEKQMLNDEIDMIWHVGDMGYADDATFHTMKTLVSFEYEGAYNDYMNWMQNITSSLPYHVTPGNHECECHDPACIVKPKELGIPLSNFSAFNARWAMPSAESGGVANMWYSWDYGALHLVSINSETDYQDAPEENKADNVFKAGHFAADGEYMRWLEADLAKAAADPSVSWIIAGGHRPFSYYSQENQDALNALFVKYGVGAYFAGHAHSYARFAAEDHNGIVHVTIGGAGCDEMLYSEENPVPGKYWGQAGQPGASDYAVSCDTWANYKWADGSQKNQLHVCQDAAFFTDAYAVGVLTAQDNGRGDLKWELFSSIDGSVIDSVAITKSNKSKLKQY